MGHIIIHMEEWKEVNNKLCSVALNSLPIVFLTYVMVLCMLTYNKKLNNSTGREMIGKVFACGRDATVKSRAFVFNNVEASWA